MSGLEVVALVAAIVSAFTGSSSLFIKWKERRHERRIEAQNEAVRTSLQRGAPEVQTEYDKDFARLGRAFARGDTIGRNALMKQLIILQQTVISLLTSSQTDSTGIVLPQIQTLVSSSDNARNGSINALAQKFQRMAQAAPVRSRVPLRAPSGPGQFEYTPCPGPTTFLQDADFCGVLCLKCSWMLHDKNPEGNCATAHLKWHWPGADHRGEYACSIFAKIRQSDRLRYSARYSAEELLKHKESHRPGRG